MLTVKEINEVSFGKAGFSGYRPEDVDNFIDKVAADFQELLTQRDTAVKQTEDLALLNSELAAKNADAQRKLSVLAQKVESYRADEEGIKGAVISAQRMSNAMVKEAEQKAADILSDARAQAEAKLLEANENARKITQNAESDAAKAAKEYAQLAETKKNELEEIKKQVTAFRSSLLEMYKKHLECIDHIPVFNQKDSVKEKQSAPEPVSAPEAEAQPPVEDPEPEYVPEPEPEPELEPEPPAPPAQLELEPEPEPELEAMPEPEPMMPIQEYRENPAPQPAPQYARGQHPAPRHSSAPARRQDQVQARPPVSDTYSYVQEQLPSSRLPESYLEENDLSSVGIDLNAHTNIPEALRREKSTNYSNLPFGDGVEIDGRRRKH